MVKIGQKNNKTPAPVRLRWALQLNLGIIPKSTKPERIASEP
jgi:diketogulonate reductase-like aldo/keto reductase